MFVDIAKIELKAGKGGDGAVAFRREKYEPSGGPAGGDGGNGGSIIIVADDGVKTLADFRYKSVYKAQNGENGKNKKQHGKDGEDLYIKVPVGTLIKDFKSDKIIYDMKKNKDEFIVCKGGRGGKGNTHYKSSIRQAPRFAEPGTRGEERTIKLEIKLLADVGLVGLPNVGKSTLLSIISNANPKIANYHFTTLEPNLGVCRVNDTNFVVADIPGLIEGASQGLGLGHDFLKHIERTGILVHLVDISGSEGRNPLEDYELIKNEIKAYNEKIKDKKVVVALNKSDIGADENAKKFRDRYENEVEKIFEISAASGKNVSEMMKYLAELLEKMGQSDYDTYDDDYEYFEEEKEADYVIQREEDVFFVTGPLIDNLVYRTNFEAYESVNHLQKILEDKGIIEELKEKGIRDGDTVVLADIEFEYYT